MTLYILDLKWGFGQGTLQKLKSSMGWVCRNSSWYLQDCLELGRKDQFSFVTRALELADYLKHVWELMFS